MAGDQLLGVLSLLGFEHADTVGPALRAACEEESAREVVQWLADNLRPEHLPVSKAYKPSAEEQAVAATFSASLVSHDPPDTSLGPEEVAKREATATLLDDAASKLEDEAAKVLGLEAREQKRLEDNISILRRQTEQQAQEVKSKLASLEKLVAQINELLSGECAREDLVCFNQLEEYKQLDAKLMEELRSFVSLQFGAVQGEGSGDDLLSTIDTEKLLFGDNEATMSARAVEIERMRLAYGSSLEGGVRMAALQAKHEKSLQALQGSLTRPELSSQDLDMLKAETEKQQASLDRVLARKQQILDEELPDLCQRIASMHGWDIVKADYDIELQRNKYYLEKKQMVLDVLIGRAARITALLAAAKGEARVLLGIQGCVQAVTEDLEELCSATELRLRKSAAASMLPVPEQPSSLIAQEPQAAEIEQHQQQFSERLEKMMGANVSRLQSFSGSLHAMAFRSPALLEPSLTQEDLSDAVKRLGVVNKSLIEANDAVYRQQEAFNNIMRLQRDQIGIERSVFPAFFSRPEQLKKLAAEAAGKQSPDKPRTSPPKSTQRKAPIRR